jgi:hypothetical protein
MVGSLFQLVNPIYCFRTGGIASYTPNRIGWIQNDPPGSQQFYALINFVLKRKTHIVGVKLRNAGK